MTYKSVKFLRFPYVSGIVPVKLLAESWLQQTNHYQLNYITKTISTICLEIERQIITIINSSKIMPVHVIQNKLHNQDHLIIPTMN